MFVSLLQNLRSLRLRNFVTQITLQILTEKGQYLVMSSRLVITLLVGGILFSMLWVFQLLRLSTWHSLRESYHNAISYALGLERRNIMPLGSRKETSHLTLFSRFTMRLELTLNHHHCQTLEKSLIEKNDF